MKIEGVWAESAVLRVSTDALLVLPIAAKAETEDRRVFLGLSTQIYAFIIDILRRKIGVGVGAISIDRFSSLLLLLVRLSYR
jgi:hypothetical protein